MKIVDEREFSGVHTYFIVDSFYIAPQEQRQLSIQIEPELKQMGIQYGLHYKNEPAQQRSIIVLECIPFDPVKEAVKQRIDETIQPFPTRTLERKNVVTKITSNLQRNRQMNK